MEEFTAIINPPVSAIPAVGAIQEEPVAENGRVVIRKMMRMTIPCYHRVIDGAEAAAFLKTLKEMMEHPLSVLV